MENPAIRKLATEEFPSIDDVKNSIRELLRALFKGEYKKFVLEHEDAFLLLPPNYKYLPPIKIELHEHPDDHSKVLYISLSRRIPLPPNMDLKKALFQISGRLGSVGVRIELVRKGFAFENGDESEPLAFIVFEHIIHSLAFKDRTWFLIMLLDMLRLDEAFLGGVISPKKQPKAESEERSPVAEYI